jgi:hypothetical protein
MVIVCFSRFLFWYEVGWKALLKGEVEDEEREDMKVGEKTKRGRT